MGLHSGRFYLKLLGRSHGRGNVTGTWKASMIMARALAFGGFMICLPQRPFRYSMGWRPLYCSPDQMLAMQAANWEIASHGYKWIDYKDFSRADEANHIAMAIELHQQVTGSRPQGWYIPPLFEHTVDLVCEAGGFSYISDSMLMICPMAHA